MVCVCTGHHAKPNFPKFPGQERFKGRIVHSHSYKVGVFQESNIELVLGAWLDRPDKPIFCNQIFLELDLTDRTSQQNKTNTADYKL
jgi:dimethylaniline monooxygenase (N-oxide forming)